jgi:hypothetical protein
VYDLRVEILFEEMDALLYEKAVCAEGANYHIYTRARLYQPLLICEYHPVRMPFLHWGTLA